MKFRMKVTDRFKIGEKSIFAGDADLGTSIVSNVPCVIEIDGKKTGALQIEGEVLNGKGHRDLWTKTPINLDRDILLTPMFG